MPSLERLNRGSMTQGALRDTVVVGDRAKVGARRFVKIQQMGWADKNAHCLLGL